MGASVGRDEGNVIARRAWRVTVSRAVLVLLGAFGSAAAGADAVSAVNRARTESCASAAHLHRLVESRALDVAAERIARGARLHDSVAQLPLRPSAAASIHLLGITDEAGIARAVARHFCADLANPDLREIGYARLGTSLWIIVTAPFVVPDPGRRGDLEAAALTAVNDARRHGRRCGETSYRPTAPVETSAELSAVARAHSDEMARTGVLQHEGRGGSRAVDRVRRIGYPVRSVGENIASGVPTTQEVIAGWLASPGHCANIMDPRFTTMGIAYALAPHSDGVIFWTQVFAEHVESGLAAPADRPAQRTSK